MAINISLPDAGPNLRPKITVMGVGGAGGNAVNNMIRSNLEGVDFLVANTDAQALEYSTCERKIQLGTSNTRGLGAGTRPDIGRQSAEECIDEIKSKLDGSHMIFIAAGMGGGTGTGAAPVIAQLARENGILTVGVITKPFHFEGTQRMKIAESGIEDLQQHVDTLITVPNQNLFRVANEKTTFADAFKMADDVLYAGVRGVTDLMVQPGLINLDFSDIKTVMSEMGKAMMGTAQSDDKDNRAVDAAEKAIANPLIDDVSLKGAKGLIINITGGNDLTLYEVDEAANRIKQEVQDNANIIYGTTCDERLEGIVRVSIVATGIDLNINTNHKPIEKTSSLFLDNTVYQKPTADPVVNDHVNQNTMNIENQEENNSIQSNISDPVQDEHQNTFEADSSEFPHNNEKDLLEKNTDSVDEDFNENEDINKKNIEDAISDTNDNSDKEINFEENSSKNIEELNPNDSVRKLSLFDTLDDTGIEDHKKQASVSLHTKTEPTLSNDTELKEEGEDNDSELEISKDFSNDEYNHEQEIESEDLNQDKEEELLDIPTFLRRQAN